MIAPVAQAEGPFLPRLTIIRSHSLDNASILGETLCARLYSGDVVSGFWAQLSALQIALATLSMFVLIGVIFRLIGWLDSTQEHIHACA